MWAWSFELILIFWRWLFIAMGRGSRRKSSKGAEVEMVQIGSAGEGEWKGAGHGKKESIAPQTEATLKQHIILRNLGATCHANACLELLFNAMSRSKAPDIWVDSREPFTCRLMRLIKADKGKENMELCEELLRLISRGKYNPFMMCSARDTLTRMLGTLVEEQSFDRLPFGFEEILKQGRPLRGTPFSIQLAMCDDQAIGLSTRITENLMFQLRSFRGQPKQFLPILTGDEQISKRNFEETVIIRMLCEDDSKVHELEYNLIAFAGTHGGSYQSSAGHYIAVSKSRQTNSWSEVNDGSVRFIGSFAKVVPQYTGAIVSVWLLEFVADRSCEADNFSRNDGAENTGAQLQREQVKESVIEAEAGAAAISVEDCAGEHPSTPKNQAPAVTAPSATSQHASEVAPYIQPQDKKGKKGKKERKGTGKTAETTEKTRTCGFFKQQKQAKKESAKSGKKSEHPGVGVASTAAALLPAGPITATAEPGDKECQDEMTSGTIMDSEEVYGFLEEVEATTTSAEEYHTEPPKREDAHEAHKAHESHEPHEVKEHEEYKPDQIQQQDEHMPRHQEHFNDNPHFTAEQTAHSHGPDKLLGDKEAAASEEAAATPTSATSAAIPQDDENYGGFGNDNPAVGSAESMEVDEPGWQEQLQAKFGSELATHDLILTVKFKQSNGTFSPKTTVFRVRNDTAGRRMRIIGEEEQKNLCLHLVDLVLTGALQVDNREIQPEFPNAELVIRVKAHFKIIETQL